MSQLTQEDLLNARVHLGHLSSKWHPSFAPYIFIKKRKTHIIDLNQTLQCLNKATEAMKKIIQSGKKILFVATKKNSKTLIKDIADELEQPYVNEKWFGGTLTNFFTLRKLFKKRATIHTTIDSPAYKHLTKKEQIIMMRKKYQLDKNLEGISSINRLPEAVFVVDIKKESICIKEANKLGIPIFAIVDTNSCPELVDFPIPANDDAKTSISIILQSIANSLKKELIAWKEIKSQT